MKITDFRVEKYQQVMDRPLGDSNGPSGDDLISSSILWINTDEGISGQAPMGNDYVENLFHLIEGKDPREIFSHWKNMIDYVFKAGDEGEAHSALSSIDIALWDLKSKIYGEPLWKTLGGSSRYVRAYASGIDLPLSDQEIYDLYSSAASKGISAGKLKVGLDRESDMRRIGIMQEALKKSDKPVQLIIDSNEYWSPKQAIRNIRKIEEKFEIFWAEEPARRWDYRGLKRVSQSITAAVATGENLSDIKDFMPLMENEAVDIVQVGSGASGITGLMKVADMAYGFEIPVSLMNSPVNYEAPIAAAIPNHIMLEVFHDRDAGILSTDSVIKDGYIVLGDQPGNGLSIDEKGLDKMPEYPPDGSSSIFAGRRRGAALLEVTTSEDENLDE